MPPAAVRRLFDGDGYFCYRHGATHFDDLYDELSAGCCWSGRRAADMVAPRRRMMIAEAPGRRIYACMPPESLFHGGKHERFHDKARWFAAARLPPARVPRYRSTASGRYC